MSTSLMDLNMSSPKNGGVLIALHNFLDHTKNPKLTLKTVMGKASYILLVSHKEGPIGKQHQYAFGENLHHFVKGEGWKIENVTDEILTFSGLHLGVADDTFFLLSKSDSPNFILKDN